MGEVLRVVLHTDQKVFMNTNRLRDIENRLTVAKGEEIGVGWSGRLGLADVSYSIWNG